MIDSACDIGFVGLGVMGKSLVLNLLENGYRVACYDLDPVRAAELSQQAEHDPRVNPDNLHVTDSLNAMVAALSSSQIIILSLPAGEVIDLVMDQLLVAGLHTEAVVVDTGNSLWTDSIERERRYQGRLAFFTCAVSGGEQGARVGPSLMPSGDAQAWHRVAPVFESLAAKVDPKSLEALPASAKYGEPCTTYLGPAGAGHYVKMVHNGIEYADMQLICEAYDILRYLAGLSPKRIAEVFRQWDKGPLSCYLLGVSARVLEQQDHNCQGPLVDNIVDMAGQKGTGLWTAVEALTTGAPAQSLAQAVFARSLSGLKPLRETLSEQFPKMATAEKTDADELITALEQALYGAKICAYAQGFDLLKRGAKSNGWEFDFAAIARIWRAGCIIRAALLEPINQAFSRAPGLENLLLDSDIAAALRGTEQAWRRAVAKATLGAIPCGALATALNYFDSLRSRVLPANLLQGQRDFFGAHTYRRVDANPQQRFHTLWEDPEGPEVRI